MSELIKTKCINCGKIDYFPMQLTHYVCSDCMNEERGKE